MIPILSGLLMSTILTSSVQVPTNVVTDESIISDNKINFELKTFKNDNSFIHDIDIMVTLPNQLQYDDYVIVLLPYNDLQHITYNMDVNQTVYNVDATYSYHYKKIESVIPGGSSKVLFDGERKVDLSTESKACVSNYPYAIYNDIPGQMRYKKGENGRRKIYVYANTTNVRLNFHTKIKTANEKIDSIQMVLLSKTKNVTMDIKSISFTVSKDAFTIKVEPYIKNEITTNVHYYKGINKGEPL